MGYFAGFSTICRRSITATPGFVFGFTVRVCLPGLLDLQRADLAGLEVLEAAGVLHDERQLLAADGEFHFRAAALPDPAAAAAGKGSGGAEVELAVGDEKLTFTVKDTGGFQNFEAREVGTLKVEKAGKHTLTVRAKTKPGRRGDGPAADRAQTREVTRNAIVI